MLRGSPRLVIGICLLGVWVAPPRAAYACSCLRLEATEPAQGATDVPVNTRIWLPRVSPLDFLPRLFTLRVSGGPEVPVEYGTIRSGLRGEHVGVLSPRAPLQARTRYEVVGDTGTTMLSFTTGERTDTTVPSAPAGAARRACAWGWGLSSCGLESRAVELDVPRTSPIVFVALTPTAEAPPPPALNLAYIAQPNWSPLAYVKLNEIWPVAIGAGYCITWPSPEERGWVHYGAMNGAGIFSGWRAGGPIELPPLPARPAHDGGVTVCTDLGDGGASNMDVRSDLPTRDAGVDASASTTDAAAPDRDLGPTEAEDAAMPVDERSPSDVPPLDAAPDGSEEAVVARGEDLATGGCSCRVSSTEPRGAGTSSVLLIIVLASLLVRRRRRGSASEIHRSVRRAIR